MIFDISSLETISSFTLGFENGEIATLLENSIGHRV